jgi:hypothetical protein
MVNDQVEFDDDSKQLTLEQDDFIGDMALLGDQDWTHSSMLRHGLSTRTSGDNIVDIQVTCQGEHLTALVLSVRRCR